MKSKKKVITSIILVVSLLCMGCFDGNKDRTVHPGFQIDEVYKPDFDNISFSNTPSLESPLKISNKPYVGELNFSVSWNFFDNKIFTDYGQTLSISINNLMNVPLYVYLVKIETSYGEMTSKDVGEKVDPQASNIFLGLIHMGGPKAEINFTYTVSVSLYISSNDYYYDAGEQQFTGEQLHASELPVCTYDEEVKTSDADFVGLINGDVNHNRDPFHKSVNSVFDPSVPAIRNKAVLVAGKHSGAYNIWQVMELYQFVKDNISYVSDPSTTSNYWASPNETLTAGGGDCEDKAILLGTLISAIGGTCRVYFTEDHAFCGVYIGSDPSIKASLLHSLEKFYGTTLIPFLIKDDIGYWAVCDPTGSIYFGGYPTGGSPVKNWDNSDDDCWLWRFLDEPDINVIDLIGAE